MGFVAVEVRSSALHRRVGEYPGPDHNMPACCEAMMAEMGATDSVRSDPEKGKGANLVIRYALPRGNVTENVS
jgi:5-methylcytosine-specific restriction protein A